MYCTKHKNHNVVTSSLETLLQLLRTPPPLLLPLLLSCEGITPSIHSDITRKGILICLLLTVISCILVECVRRVFLFKK